MSRSRAQLVVIGIGTAAVQLDTAVNVAFPAITRGFGLAIDDIRWVVISYVLTYASLLLACGRVGDRFGHALDQARAQLRSGKATTGDYVEVKMPVSIHLAFRKRGRGVSPESGIARCFCIFKQDPDGSSVCICRGPDAAVCDCELVVV